MDNSFLKLKELTNKLPLVPHDNSEAVRVLVIENDTRTRKLIANALDYFGCNCKTVENGKEAMDIIAKEKFQVLLGHIIIAEEVGVGVLRLFQDCNPNSVIVIISGSGFYDLIKKAS